MKRLLTLLRLAAGACCLVALAASADDFPNRQIRLVVPYSAGGSTDSLARQIGTQLQDYFKQPVVVDNRPGGNNAVAANFVASSPADGYTLLFNDPGLLAINPSLYKKLPYDKNAFVPVALVTRFSFMLLVNPANPARNLQEFVAQSKARKEPLAYGSPSAGTPPHLGMEMVKAATGIEAIHAPYKGAAPALNDLMGGQIDAMFIDIASGLQYVKSGKLRALAISSTSRNPLLPDVPTFAESGYPGFEVGAWNGIVAPRGTPPAVVKKLNEAFRAVVARPDLADWIRSVTTVPDAKGSPEDYGRQIQADSEKWGAIARKLDITLD